MQTQFFPRSVSASSFKAIEKHVNFLIDALENYSVITVLDFCNITGQNIILEPNSCHYGWTDLSGLEIKNNYGVYTLILPEPEEIKNFDPSKYELTIKIRGDYVMEMTIGDSLDNPKYAIRKDSNDFLKAYYYAFERISKECERRRHESIS